jgi:putative glutamine amidotransferase
MQAIRTVWMVWGPVILLGLGLGHFSGCGQSRPSARPLIGITSVYEPPSSGTEQIHVPFAYIRAVEDNGGVPVVLPTVHGDETIDRYVAQLDGLVLIGGADIPPEVYGQEPHPTVEVVPDQRFAFERRLVERWWRTRKPLLGVCLGMQMVNVVRGGTLIQDIPSQVGTEIAHRQPGGVYHTVRLETGSTLAWRLGAPEVTVLSNHHQAVDRLGRGLRIAARSADGVIEAMERTDGAFGLFVQWHPESMDDLKHRDAIYGALVRTCVKPQKGVIKP